MKWHDIQVKGRMHAIPRVCPNCLGPGDRASLLSSGSLRQTFYYCAPCQRLINVPSALQASMWLIPIVAGFGILALSLVVSERTGSEMNAFLLWGAWLGGSAAGILGFRVFYLKLHALNERQVVRGPAASCELFLSDMARNTVHYRALRREWLVEFIRLNPESVDPQVLRDFPEA